MTDVERVYTKLKKRGVKLFNYANTSVPAVVVEAFGNTGMFINERMVQTTAGEKCVVVHEYAHIATCSLHSVYASAEDKARDEHRAIKYTVHLLLPFSKLKAAVKDGDTEVWQIAERYNLTEDVVRDAIEIYRQEGKE